MYDSINMSYPYIRGGIFTLIGLLCFATLVCFAFGLLRSFTETLLWFTRSLRTFIGALSDNLNKRAFIKVMLLFPKTS